MANYKKSVRVPVPDPTKIRRRLPDLDLTIFRHSPQGGKMLATFKSVAEMKAAYEEEVQGMQRERDSNHADLGNLRNVKARLEDENKALRRRVRELLGYRPSRDFVQPYDPEDLLGRVEILESKVAAITKRLANEPWKR